MTIELPASLMAGLGTVAVSGWTITVWVVRLIIAGRLVPGRLMDAKDVELNATKSTLEETRQQNNVLLSETVPTMTKLMEALRTTVAAQQERS